MKCGSFYYYKSGYELKPVKEFPEFSSEDYDSMIPYCFLIEDALGSYNPTDDEKTGLFEAWEFNGEAEDDPGTKYHQRCGTCDGRTRPDLHVGRLAHAALAHVVACEQGYL